MITMLIMMKNNNEYMIMMIISIAKSQVKYISMIMTIIRCINRVQKSNNNG